MKTKTKYTQVQLDILRREISEKPLAEVAEKYAKEWNMLVEPLYHKIWNMFKKMQETKAHDRPPLMGLVKIKESGNVFRYLLLILNKWTLRKQWRL